MQLTNVGERTIPCPDLYLLASIPHDWNDHDAIRILRRCAQVGSVGSRVLIIDRTYDQSNPLTFTFMNLLMRVFLGGRERTVEQFVELGTASGLALQSATPIPSGLSLLTFIVDSCQQLTAESDRARERRSASMEKSLRNANECAEITG